MNYEMHMLRFYVRVWDPRTETNTDTPVTLTKDQLRAAGLVGLSSKEVIACICERRGFKVLEIGKAARRTVSIDLDELWSWEPQSAPIDPLEVSD